MKRVPLVFEIITCVRSLFIASPVHGGSYSSTERYQLPLEFAYDKSGLLTSNFPLPHPFAAHAGGWWRVEPIRIRSTRPCPLRNKVISHQTPGSARSDPFQNGRSSPKPGKSHHTPALSAPSSRLASATRPNGMTPCSLDYHAFN